MMEPAEVEVNNGSCKPIIKIYGNPGLGSRIAEFQEKAANHQKRQLANPFSVKWQKPNQINTATGGSKNAHLPFDKSDPRYGRPPEGSKTEARGQKAGCQISKEIGELCRIIRDNGQLYEDGTAIITFGELFHIYTTISNKLVGILLRARKHQLLQFEGEMLFQRRDEEVPIVLYPDPEVSDSSEENDETEA